jgi:autotransporter-associated beta strand protein
MHLTKVGAGTLTLTGANTYTGHTIVRDGTLSINNGYLADASTVVIDSGAVFNLNFSGTDTIGSLLLGGVPVAPGTYNAANSSGLIAGTGSLMVTSQFLPGDFDADGDVDAADLTAWQGDFGATAGSDSDIDFDSDGADFLAWQRNLGTDLSPATAASGAVPEPACMTLVVIGLIAFATRSRCRK